MVQSISWPRYRKSDFGSLASEHDLVLPSCTPDRERKAINMRGTNWGRRRLPYSLVILAVAVVATGSLAGSGGSARAAGGSLPNPPPGKFQNKFHSGPLPAPPLPDVNSEPSNICGPWSAVSSPEARAVAAHGTLQSCQLIGQDWVVVTMHGAAAPGEVGVQQCPAGSACMDGRLSHDLTNFRWFPAPTGTALTELQVSGPVITFVDGSGQIEFHLDSLTWSKAGQ